MGNTISTIAGTGVGGYSGDGDDATIAAIYQPSGIVIDSNENVYFCEILNHLIRKITVATGIISTYAGTGDRGYSGDGGAASSAELNSPNGLCIDASGTSFHFIFYYIPIINLTLKDNLYVAEYAEIGTGQVRKIAASNDIISSIVDSLNRPVGVAVDVEGRLLTYSTMS